ncbi:hypothetical protein UCDDS831_g05018 [Diplodia seriata]|uniref:Uncharacterized protein n=1 Tax=Diplodia seriata TaxID=420778 RepID=A0A0G2GTG9_9PEZI|nr:hypothetical protein UCDDS831_g05018 [Diplodia seriata]
MSAPGRSRASTGLCRSQKHSASCASAQSIPRRLYFNNLVDDIWAHKRQADRLAAEEHDANSRPTKNFKPSKKARSSFAFQVVVRMNEKARFSNANSKADIAPLYSLRTYKAIPDFPRTVSEIDELSLASLEDILYHLGTAIPRGRSSKRWELLAEIGWWGLRSIPSRT